MSSISYIDEIVTAPIASLKTESTHARAGSANPAPLTRAMYDPAHPAGLRGVVGQCRRPCLPGATPARLTRPMESMWRSFSLSS